MVDIVAKIASELKLVPAHVHNSVKLLFTEQCTIPFVARYRKEMTGTMDEVALRNVRDRYHYLVELEDSKKKYLKVVEEHCQKNAELKAKFPELRAKFEACATKQELEDLYLPFKPKRRTRAQVAKEKGLEPLLSKILAARATLSDLLTVALDFVTQADANIDPALKVDSAEAALTGAADILAERIAETAEIRASLREETSRGGFIVAKKIEQSAATAAKEAAASTEIKSVGMAPAPGKSKKERENTGKYENYFDYRESVSTAAGHRIMAVRRGEAEKVLRVSLEVDEKHMLEKVEEFVIGNTPTSADVRTWLRSIIADAYQRLLGPSIETEVRLALKSRAEEEAIRVFSKNLQNLLLLPPIPGKSVLGVDPGIRTGSKLAVVSETGKHLFSTTIYPDPGGKDDAPKTVQAKSVLANTLKTFNIQCVAIGNGTGSREIDKVITSVIKEEGLKGVKRAVVNEAGASVYSTDEIAREEFPDLDATIRSAISIARRLQDPLAELVKIDPRSIGVGQYQHDVNVTKLKTSLEEVVESCVNKVGVNLNTASHKLLSYVSGIGPALAKGIVTHRDKNGKFENRGGVLSVPGFGPKAYEQAAGFLRVPESSNPLDNSAVHPERYEIIEAVASSLNVSVSDLIGKQVIVDAVPWERYVTATVGMPTLRDIAIELVKPGRDPREDGARLMYSDEVSSLEDLKQNMILKGTVTNVTNFGAFVDIGVHQDGLVHISELSEKFIKDPNEAAAVGDVLEVRVIDVDMARKRISLSCKLQVPTSAPAPSAGAQSADGTRDQGRGPRPSQGKNGDQSRSTTGGGAPKAPRPPQFQYQPKPEGAAGFNSSGSGNRGAAAFQTQSNDQRKQKNRPTGPQQTFTVDDLLSKFNRK